MASIRMVPEGEAVGDVRAIYDEIEQQFGIDFVPNLYRVMATNPAYLAANWNKVKAIMFAPGKLDRLTKEIIAVTVSAVQGCKY
jgi:alkylhydroperoxidase/carboxymuconolactone decarboxylase family protein YurZ